MSATNRSTTAPEPAVLTDYDPNEGEGSQKRSYGSESTSEDSSEEEDEFGGSSGTQWGEVGLEAGVEELLLGEKQPPPPGE